MTYNQGEKTMTARDNAREERALKIKDLVDLVTTTRADYVVSNVEQELISMVEKYAQRVYYLQDVLEKCKAKNKEMQGDRAELEELKYRIRTRLKAGDQAAIKRI